MNDLDQWFVIRNPTAGNGAGKKEWKKIERALQVAGIGGESMKTKKRRHASDLVKEGLNRGYRNFIAVGGDGTNNEVINGVFQQEEIDPSEINYTLIPVGTGNDWIRTHGIPRDYREWIPNIRKGKIIQQDIGWVTYHDQGKKEKRYFTNVAGLAFDGHICEASERTQTNTGNSLFYLGLIFKELFNYDLRKARITFDDQSLEDFFYTINVGICKYSGGGMQFVPHAIPDDGLLALTAAGKLSKLEVLLNTWRFYTGDIGSHSKVNTFQTKNIKIEAVGDQPTLVEVDGEFLGETPVEIGILEKVLNVMVP